jgi:hypothetical protein
MPGSVANGTHCISVVKYVIKRFLLAVGQLKVCDVGAFSNKCWSLLLRRGDNVVTIVAGLEAEKLRNTCLDFRQSK